MILSYQRILRRLRGIVRRSRPGNGHAARVDGWPVTAFAVFDPDRRSMLECLHIATRHLEEAARLARAYWGTDFFVVEEQIDRGAVTTWRALTPDSRPARYPNHADGGIRNEARPGVPAVPAAVVHHSPRDLARTIGLPAMVLELAGTIYEPAD